MGFVAVLKNFVRTSRGNAKFADTTLADGLKQDTCEHFAPAGDDAHPLNNDYAIAVTIPASGRAVSVGYVDPQNQGVTQPGGKRIYARNTDGQTLGQLWLKNTGEVIMSTGSVSITETPDGTCTITNNNGTISLLSNGNVNINGVIFEPGARMSQITSFKTDDDKELKDHIHSGVDAGPDNTGPNV